MISDEQISTSTFENEATVVYINKGTPESVDVHCSAPTRHDVLLHSPAELEAGMKVVLVITDIENGLEQLIAGRDDNPFAISTVSSQAVITETVASPLVDDWFIAHARFSGNLHYTKKNK